MPRIFVGFFEVAGFYANLVRGFHELGVPATFVDLGDHPFRYERGRRSLIVRWTATVATRRRATTRHVRRLLWTGAEGLLRSVILLWALVGHDVVILGFGSTFLGMRALELRLLKLCRKRVICMFHGSDSRPPYLDGSVMASGLGRSIEECARLTSATKKLVGEIDRFADCVIDNPLSSHFHERPCVLWIRLGLPFRGPEPAPPERRASRGPVRVLHSPSHPEAKGTDRIRAAIRQLQQKGHDIEFVEITGQPHAEVLRQLATCDFVVDQLYSDTPMAGFATEAAHFGKPAVVGGYEGDVIRRMVPPSAMPPTLYCHPDAVAEAIESLVTDELGRIKLGERARRFVHDQWSPRDVAARFLRLAMDDVPPEWLFEPADICHVHGCGLSEERVRALVAGLVAEGGRAALCVADKPDLERALLELAAGTTASAKQPALPPVG